MQPPTNSHKPVVTYISLRKKIVFIHKKVIGITQPLICNTPKILCLYSDRWMLKHKPSPERSLFLSTLVITMNSSYNLFKCFLPLESISSISISNHLKMVKVTLYCVCIFFDLYALGVICVMQSATCSYEVAEIMMPCSAEFIMFPSERIQKPLHNRSIYLMAIVDLPSHQEKCRCLISVELRLSPELYRLKKRNQDKCQEAQKKNRNKYHVVQSPSHCWSFLRFKI